MRIALFTGVYLCILSVGCFEANGVNVKDSKNKILEKKPSTEQLRKTLSPMEFKVTQENGTEPAFNNEFWNNKEPGIYVDKVTGQALFSSGDKYDSGCGWPSFTKPLEPANVTQKKDLSHGMERVEVRSKTDSHLGHVFEDGPKDKGGLRYCINSAAIRFIPLKDLEKEGYAQYLPLFKKD